ncbi:MAG: protein kinase, partial [Planctomycetales bacterium]|nr:protein kinase [Planctomycetales bacterium]
MDLVDGVPITDFCDQRKLKLEERVELLIKTCRAVQHAHQKGIIHRDLKPSNVLVTFHNGIAQPKVIDFGVAKAIDPHAFDRTTLTRTSQIVGTPQYMSPEQAGRFDVDTRTDVFSLGVLLFELLTGSTPLDQKKMREAAYDEICRMIREDDPPKPSSRLSSLGEDSGKVSSLRSVDSNRLERLVRGDLDWITIKSMEKDRERRYESVDALEKDLQRFLDQEPVLAGPPSRLYRLSKFVRRNRSLTVSLMIAVASIVVGTTVALMALREAIEQREIALQNEANGAMVSAKALSTSHAVGQQVDGLAAVARAKVIFDELGENRVFELRNYAIRCLAAPDVSFSARYEHPQDLDERESFDASLDYFSYVDGAVKQAVVLHLPTQEKASFPVQATKTTLSPNADYLILRDQQQTYFYSRPTTEEIFRIPGNHGWWQPFGFNADGSRVGLIAPVDPAALEGDQAVFVYTMPSGDALAEINPPESATGIAVDAKGQRIAVTYGQHSSNKVCSVFDIVTKDERFAHKRNAAAGEAASAQVVAFHPSDPNVVAFDAYRDVLMRDMKHPYRFSRFEGHRDQVAGLEFHPSGKWLFTTAFDNVTKVWDTQSLELILTLPGRIRKVSRDGHRFGLRTQPDHEVWNFHDSAFSHLPPGVKGEGNVLCSAIHPHGRLAVTGGVDVIRFWDLTTRRIVSERFLSKHFSGNDVFRFVKFSESGDVLWLGGQRSLLWKFSIQQESADDKLSFRIGNPTQVIPANGFKVAFNDSGTRIAVQWKQPKVNSSVVRVYDASGNPVSGEIDLVDHSPCHISPDGRWLTTWGYQTDNCRLYDVQKGNIVLQVPLGRGQGWFSPDGKLVAFANHRNHLRLYEVPGFTRVKLDVPFETDTYEMAFSKDSRLLAVSRLDPRGVVLIDLQKRTVIAELHGNVQTAARSFFANDSCLLVTNKSGPTSLGVWDISRIRSELTKLGLDWEQPPVQSTPSDLSQLPELRVDIDWGEHPISKLLTVQPDSDRSAGR